MYLFGFIAHESAGRYIPSASVNDKSRLDSSDKPIVAGLALVGFPPAEIHV